jgi:hypothetical protein
MSSGLRTSSPTAASKHPLELRGPRVIDERHVRPFGIGLRPPGQPQPVERHRVAVRDDPRGSDGRPHLWLSVSSNDSSASATDIISVEVVDAGVTSLLGTFSNLNKGAARVYSMKTFSLANWCGKTVTLRFRATTNNEQPTSFSVDDV